MLAFFTAHISLLQVFAFFCIFSGKYHALAAMISHIQNAIEPERYHASHCISHRPYHASRLYYRLYYQLYTPSRAYFVIYALFASLYRRHYHLIILYAGSRRFQPAAKATLALEIDEAAACTLLGH